MLGKQRLWLNGNVAVGRTILQAAVIIQEHPTLHETKPHSAAKAGSLPEAFRSRLQDRNGVDQGLGHWIQMILFGVHHSANLIQSKTFHGRQSSRAFNHTVNTGSLHHTA